MRTPRLLPVLVASSLVFAACGDDGGQTAAPPVTGPDPAVTATTSTGWIGGEPEWHGSDMPSTTFAGGASDRDAAASGTVASGADEACCDAPSVAPQNAPRAGSVDDNVDYAGYLAYRERIRSLGIPIRDIDATGRIVLTVTGSDGRPVHGADVAISGIGFTHTTDAAGQVVFLPAAAGGPVAESYTFSVGSDSVTAAPGTTASLELAQTGGIDVGIPLDVQFVLDVTGSMGDEIDQLKRTVSVVASRIEALPSRPDVRFGMTLYRDEGDTFVTSTFDLTDVIEDFQHALDDVVADGGGDTPEALDEALAEALDVPSWRDRHDAVQLVFLVADAAPHVERTQVTPYTESMLAASARGITVHTIAASNTDDAAEHAFRSIAQATGGRFVFLTYGAGGAATGASTDIDSTDYEELSLDDLVVRLVSEELDALTGTTTPTPTTTTTNPPNQ